MDPITADIRGCASCAQVRAMPRDQLAVRVLPPSAPKRTCRGSIWRRSAGLWPPCCSVSTLSPALP